MTFGNVRVACLLALMFRRGIVPVSAVLYGTAGLRCRVAAGVGESRLAVGVRVCVFLPSSLDVARAVRLAIVVARSKLAATRSPIVIRAMLAAVLAPAVLRRFLAGGGIGVVADASCGTAGRSISTGRPVPRRPAALAGRLASARCVTHCCSARRRYRCARMARFVRMLTRRSRDRGFDLARGHGLPGIGTASFDVQMSELNIDGPLHRAASCDSD